MENNIDLTGEFGASGSNRIPVSDNDEMYSKEVTEILIRALQTRGINTNNPRYTLFSPNEQGKHGRVRIAEVVDDLGNRSWFGIKRNRGINAEDAMAITQLERRVLELLYSKGASVVRPIVSEGELILTDYVHGPTLEDYIQMPNIRNNPEKIGEILRRNLDSMEISRR